MLAKPIVLNCTCICSEMSKAILEMEQATAVHVNKERFKSLLKQCTPIAENFLSKKLGVHSSRISDALKALKSVQAKRIGICDRFYY